MTVGAERPPRDVDGISYPPPPWRLVGTVHVSLWQVATDAVPRGHLGVELEPLSVAGRTPVVTAFAAYGPAGDLAYGELLVAVRARGRGRSFTHVPLIWVDHRSSVAGARALWRIPKEMAAIRFGEGRPGSAEATGIDGAPLAGLRFAPGPALPGRWPLRTRIAQGPLAAGDPSLTVTPVRASARVRLGRADWTIPREGPLGFLADARPLASVRLDDVALAFG